MIEKSTVMTDRLDSMKQEYYTMITKNDEATMRYTNIIADLTVNNLKENIVILLKTKMSLRIQLHVIQQLPSFN